MTVLRTSSAGSNGGPGHEPAQSVGAACPHGGGASSNVPSPRSCPSADCRASRAPGRYRKGKSQEPDAQAVRVTMEPVPMRCCFKITSIGSNSSGAAKSRRSPETGAAGSRHRCAATEARRSSLASGSLRGGRRWRTGGAHDPHVRREALRGWPSVSAFGFGAQVSSRCLSALRVRCGLNRRSVVSRPLSRRGAARTASLRKANPHPAQGAPAWPQARSARSAVPDL